MGIASFIEQLQIMYIVISSFKNHSLNTKVFGGQSRDSFSH